MNLRINMFALLWAVCLSSSTFYVSAAEASAVAMNKEEQAFQQLLNDSVLKGSFTMTGKHEQEGLAPETYEIKSLDKMADGKWRFMVRINYHNTDVTVPLFLEVKWASDTPMIYVDKIFVPGIGTYSARVIFHDKRYAGTWNGDGYGGHLFGKVERALTPAKEAEKDVTAADKKASE